MLRRARDLRFGGSKALSAWEHRFEARLQLNGEQAKPVSHSRRRYEPEGLDARSCRRMYSRRENLLCVPERKYSHSSAWWKQLSAKVASVLGKKGDTYIRVPVQLPERSRLESHDRRSDGLRYGEVAGVDCLNGSSAAGGLFGFNLAGFEDVGAVAFELAEGRVDALLGEVGLEDVGVGGGDGVEEGFVDAYFH